MATVTFKGNSVETVGSLPALGAAAPDFVLVRQDLSEASLSDYPGKTRILNIFPSLDTSVCATSVKKFWEQAGQRPDTVILNISMDLPFAHGRFCQAEGLDNVKTLSAFRGSFGKDYGVAIGAGPLAGLLSRAVVVIDKDGRVAYIEQVSEITDEPDYAAALAALS